LLILLFSNTYRKGFDPNELTERLRCNDAQRVGTTSWKARVVSPLECL